MPAKQARTAREYVSAIDPGRRGAFAELRAMVRAALPKARETMAYNMPTYELAGTRACAIAAQKHHFALYLCESDALQRQRAAFEHLDLGHGCVRFRSPDDLPLASITKLLRTAAREAEAAARGAQPRTRRQR